MKSDAELSENIRKITYIGWKEVLDGPRGKQAKNVRKASLFKNQ